MKIIADDKIPFLKGIPESFAEVIYLPGATIDSDQVKDADALLIRTRTQCNEALLHGSSVRFIGTATIGMDHIDIDFCKKNKIYVTNAPGCNADSVAQYILSSLLSLSLKNGFSLRDKTAGIIGVGNVGKKVKACLEKTGMNVLLNDPPRAEKEQGFVDLKIISEACDIITFHPPLTRSGKYPTYHLGNEDFFHSLKKRPIICNSSRGEVIDTESLKKSFADRLLPHMIIDCWENEPHIDLSILHDAYISTPHIAGYSTDGKMNATRMIIQSLSDFFHLDIDLSQLRLPDFPNNIIDMNAFPDHRTENAILATYDPISDSDLLKKDPIDFEKFRNQYGIRREYPAYSIKNATPEESKALSELGFTCI